MGSEERPRRVDGLSGTVESGPFGTGSKSERQAIWLRTAHERLVLRRKDGPSYGDTTLGPYVGKFVRCDGFIVGYLLLAERIEVVQ